MSTTDTTETAVATIDEALGDEKHAESPGILDAEVVHDSADSDSGDLAVARDVPAPQAVEEKSTFSLAKARKHTEKLKGAVELSAELFVEAYNGRIWLAYGDLYKGPDGWGRYLDAEIGELRPRLPKAQRLELVAGMKNGAKMSQTAIAATLRMDQKTISNDLRELREAHAAGVGEEVTTETSGLDEKFYQHPRSSSSRHKKFVDRVTDAVNGVYKALGQLSELRAEDEWNAEAPRIAGRHRQDFARLVQELEALAATLDDTEDSEATENDNTYERPEDVSDTDDYDEYAEVGQG